LIALDEAGKSKTTVPDENVLMLDTDRIIVEKVLNSGVEWPDNRRYEKWANKDGLRLETITAVQKLMVRGKLVPSILCTSNVTNEETLEL
jgi:ABC-type Fe3+-hydroxamate transport system substrate-binding protein